jgi:hypothetical protein
MAQASARRTFHGPITTHAARAPRARKPRRHEPTLPSRPLELVPPPPSASSVGRAVLAVARTEQPSTNERERILTGVLEALQLLTSANR